MVAEKDIFANLLALMQNGSTFGTNNSPSRDEVEMKNFVRKIKRILAESKREKIIRG
jgi:hypothetical protein